ncbi:mucin-3A-like [Mizuhopecten yessoensis]|uniref:mucin-3A-like n=1 Tax=Mizuhopecten yessoensis TaxID=6573 RepID=UPI000B45ED0B|nr:mucin-3A-like [Mizuhopecten yessoensis]
MDRRKSYKDPNVDYIRPTDRKNSNELYVPIPYVRDNGEDRSVSSGMAFGNYAISNEYAVEDPHWNTMAYNSKRHWFKANWSEQYVESNSRSDDVSRDEHNYRSKRRHGREDFARPSPRDKKGGNTNIKHSALAVFMVAVVVAIPLLIIFVFRKGSPIIEGTIDLELKLSDQFQKGMEDPTSTVFKSTEQELCTEVEQAFITDVNFQEGTKYVCNLKSLRNGSIIVTFVIIVIGSYTIPGDDQYVQAVTIFIGAARTLGSFTVISESIVVKSASYTQQGVQITTTTSEPTTTTFTPESTTTTPELTTTTTTPNPTTTTPEPTTTTTTPEQTTTTTTPEQTTATTTPEHTTTTTTPEQTTTTTEQTTTTTPQQTTTTTTPEQTTTTTTQAQTTMTTTPEPTTLTTTPEPTTTTTTPEPSTTTITPEQTTTTTTPEQTTTTTTPEQTTTTTPEQTTTTTTPEPTTTTIFPPEMEMNDSITRPEEEITISCNVRYAPSGWDNFSIVSVNNDDIHVTAFSNGTFQQGNSSYTARLQQSSPDMILSVLFLNTTTHCYARGSYVCTLIDNGIIVINNTATVIITDIASNLTLEGNGTVNEGDRYEMSCSGRVATEGGELHLHVRSGNTSDFIRTTEVPIVTVGDFNDMCYQSITKNYGFIAEKVQNGTEFACVATNVKLTSYQSTTSIDMVVDFADFNTQLHLQNTTWIPAYGDKNSPEFKSFAEKIENDTDYVYERSNIKDNYKKSKVIGLEKKEGVYVTFVMHIVTQVVLTDSSGNVITTKLTPTDIVSAFVDTLPTVANDLTSSDLIDLDTNNIVTDVIIDPGDGYECSNTKTDIVILLDASGSVGRSNFVLMKVFILNITGNILLDPNGIQISIAKFSTYPNNEFWLNEHHGVYDLRDAIDSIVYTGGGTYISRALQFVRDNTLTAANGARADSEKIIILMTDGVSADSSTTIASTLRNDGVLVISVGIGRGIYKDQLDEIAYNTSYVFIADDFITLTTQIRDTVKGSACGTIDNNFD